MAQLSWGLCISKYLCRTPVPSADCVPPVNVPSMPSPPQPKRALKLTPSMKVKPFPAACLQLFTPTPGGAGVDFYTSITRARLEELNGDLFRGCVGPVERVVPSSSQQARMLPVIHQPDGDGWFLVGVGWHWVELHSIGWRWMVLGGVGWHWMALNAVGCCQPYPHVAMANP